MRNAMKAIIDAGGEGLKPLFIEAMRDYSRARIPMGGGLPSIRASSRPRAPRRVLPTAGATADAKRAETGSVLLVSSDHTYAAAALLAASTRFLRRPITSAKWSKLEVNEPTPAVAERRSMIRLSISASGILRLDQIPAGPARPRIKAEDMTAPLRDDLLKRRGRTSSSLPS